MDSRLFLKKNFIFGSIIGLSFCLTLYIFYKTGNMFSSNMGQDNVIMLLSVVGMFLGSKNYRDSILNGYITYGKALLTSFYIIATASLIYSIFVYNLYSNDSDIFKAYMDNTKEAMEIVYGDKANNLMEIIDNFTSPATIAIGYFFRNIFIGFIFALPISNFVKRKA